MARKQIGIKLEEEDLARWDAFAESQGWSRTELFETAVERLIGSVAFPGSVSKHKPEELERAPEAKIQPGLPGGKPYSVEHRAKPGIRRVFVCAHRDRAGVSDCQQRVFLRDEPAEFVPACREHGPMKRQANHPYMGQSTEPLPEQGWPKAEA